MVELVVFLDFLGDLVFLAFLDVLVFLVHLLDLVNLASSILHNLRPIVNLQKHLCHNQLDELYGFLVLMERF